MTESMLKSLMKLFALLATINIDATRIFSRNFVESFLKGQLSPKLIESSMRIFDQNMEELSPIRNQNINRRITLLSVKILRICNEINQELHLRSKYLILISIIQFAKHFIAQSDSSGEYKVIILDAINTIADSMMINAPEYENCKAFITDRFYKVPDRNALMVLNSMDRFTFSDIKHLQIPSLKGQFFFLRINQADLYIFYYSGNEILELGGNAIFPNHIYVFPKGASIKAAHIKPIYFGDIVNAFYQENDYPQIELTAENLEYTYPNSDNGVHSVNLKFATGEMIGVMGGSGTGKSTLMGLLNGTISPDQGQIYINGARLELHEEKLEGIIGFVPQDDLLIEELTVFENLYYNAKLCLGDLDEKEVIKRIGKVLNDLGLFYIKDLQVGSPLNKYISGGQRKRLNIALELIRQPYILFVDEPTSGLSSTDSENVLLLLKEQAISGKIVVVNIHQPSSEMFKLFNQIIIMDKEGYPVYFGNPLDSISYLKSIAHRADADEIECETCGNVNTDDILKIIEAKKVNEFGEYTKKRLIKPAEWYKLFKERIEIKLEKIEKIELPEVNFKIPSGFQQFLIYSKRNLVTKIADSQFVALSLSITPILAVILAFFTKYLGGNSNGNPEYVFSLNENIPAFLFMSVIVSLFVGMIISAEEIIGDSRMRIRESFLNLNKYAYFNSKILFLFILSAFQMLVFVLLGNAILGIKGLNFNYWLILFSTSCFAVMLGLNISAGLKSVISIYINIPFILVPLILLSGVIVSYDKLHYRVAGQEFVPLVGDMMASRWAYEALVVNQYKNNEYEKVFFDLDREQGNAQYYINFLIPELKNKTADLIQSIQTGDQNLYDRNNQILQNTIPFLPEIPPELKVITKNNINTALIFDYLENLNDFLIQKSAQLTSEKDSLIQLLIVRMGGEENLVKVKRDYQNEAVSDLVLNTNELKKIVEFKGRLIRKDTPIYQYPDSRIGRAHFFAATKYLGKWEINTVVFNILILFLMSIILYIALVNDLLRKMLDLRKRKDKS